MALRGLGGIDPFLFGNGIAGDISHTTDFTQLFDAVTRNWKAVKASGGDPNFTVTAPGWRIFATREIHIGGGVTLSARGTIGGTNSGGAAAGGAGATAGTMGSGTAGGSVSLNVGLTPGAGGGGVDNTRSIGGSGGAGGTAGGGIGGPGGVADADDLLGTDNQWNHLLNGAGVVNGSFLTFRGGCGGGAGGAAGSAGGTNHPGAGGGGGGIIILAAPLITIDIGALVTVKGGDGGDESGTTWDSGGGGGGGGGGGAIILIYGRLNLNGELNADGGDGGSGSSAGKGGFGGAGGHIYHFGGTDDTIFRESGSAGANAT